MVDWDRSRIWVVQHTRHNRVRLLIRWSSRPDLPQLLALRRLRPEYQEMTPAQLKAAATESGILDVGTFGRIEGHQLLRAARELGLPIHVEDASFSSYLPIDRTVPTAQSALLIEDDAEAERTAKEMIAAGCAVEYVEAC